MVTKNRRTHLNTLPQSRCPATNRGLLFSGPLRQPVFHRMGENILALLHYLARIMPPCSTCPPSKPPIVAKPDVCVIGGGAAGVAGTKPRYWCQNLTNRAAASSPATFCDALVTPAAPLFHSGLLTVHHPSISQKDALQTRSHSKLPPQGATVSASKKTGRVISQLFVRMAICVLRSPLGLVPRRSRWPTRHLRVARARESALGGCARFLRAGSRSRDRGEW